MEILTLLQGSVERAPWGWVLTIAFLTALVKVWPQLSLQASDAAAKLRGEKRADLDSCKTRLDAMETRLNKAIGQIHQLDIKLVGTVAAYKILHDEIEGSDPENSSLINARAVFRAHWDGFIDATEPNAAGLI